MIGEAGDRRRHLETHLADIEAGREPADHDHGGAP
jgi:hypothetical protein